MVTTKDTQIKSSETLTTPTLICSTEILTMPRKHTKSRKADIKFLKSVARHTLQDQLVRIKKELTNSTGQSPFSEVIFHSCSRNSLHFVQPKDSLSCSQEPTTGPYPQPDKSSPCHPIIFL
jgi:hypothetical protein